MRWGDWYVHDASTLRLVRINLFCPMHMLRTPASVCAFVDQFLDVLTAADVLSLTIAANELSWHSFSFHGIGDWTDEDGQQRGAARQLVAVAR